VLLIAAKQKILMNMWKYIIQEDITCKVKIKNMHLAFLINLPKANFAKYK